MSLVSRLEAYGRVSLNEDMRRHTTYKIGGTADYYIQPDSQTSLMCILDILHEDQVPYFVLGRGSNLLIEDKPFHGAIINLDKTLNSYYLEKNGILVAEAGCSIIHLSAEAAKHGLSGLEFAYGIPGSIGGGLYMNAGAYRHDLAEILIDVCVLKDNEIVWIPKEELDYGYRHSLFQKKKDWTILAGRFALEQGSKEKIYSVMESRRQRRMDSQPLNKPCAGSVFRNPAEMPAWEIIEKMGFRGMQKGGAKVSEKHCNFIVNENGLATTSDVLYLIDTIQKKAKADFGIELITEVEHLNW